MSIAVAVLTLVVVLLGAVAAFSFVQSLDSSKDDNPVASQTVAPSPSTVTVTATATETTTATATALATVVVPVPAPSPPTTLPEATPSYPTGGQVEQEIIDTLQMAMNSQDWGLVNSLCNPAAECQRQFTDFFAQRYASGQWLATQLGKLHSCTASVPPGWESGCTSPANWLFELVFSCQSGGQPGMQREVGFVTFDYSQGAKISRFEPVSVLEWAPECD